MFGRLHACQRRGVVSKWLARRLEKGDVVNGGNNIENFNRQGAEIGERVISRAEVWTLGQLQNAEFWGELDSWFLESNRDS